MRLLPAFVLGYLTVVGGPGEPAAPKLAQGLTQPAMAEIDHALGFGLAPEPPPFDPALDAPKRFVTTNGRVVSLPNGCRSVSRPFDLLIHFHGAPPVLEAAFERADIDGALAILNLGIGSGRYDAAFQMAGSFDQLLVRIGAVIHDLCPGAAEPRRIGLSSWSAGYGAVFRILDHGRDAARVDAVLLADGLHAGFEVGGERERRPLVDQLAPFMTLSDEAASGHKLFALTHSSIVTPYASTTETADFLLAQLNLERHPSALPPPRPGMNLTSRADSGNFHVLGFTGADEKAHGDQLHAFGDTLLPYLKERWSLPPAH